MSDENCIFCKIIAGAFPSVKVYEDDAVIAFMDIMPQSDGHLLVVPKMHGANLWDIDNRAAEAMIRVTQRLAKAAKTALEADGVQIMQFNGAAAGQTVFHVHTHIIPRWAGQDLRFHARDRVDPASLVPRAAKIAGALQS
jgi:histidine triad (HIT) family protein